AWLKDRLDGTQPEWPAPTTQTVYVLYYPEGTMITYKGYSACDSFFGYHESVPLANGTRAVYAVIPRCATFPGAGRDLTGVPLLTVESSHEIVEAATDPYPTSSPAYFNEMPVYFGLPGGSGPELADMCAPGIDASLVIKPADLPFLVQRSWSNAA